jgi:hypothetical protein
MIGVALTQVVLDRIPEPTHSLKWGEDMPVDIQEALARGETAILNDVNGEPYSFVLKDNSGQTREQLIMQFEPNWGRKRASYAPKIKRATDIILNCKTMEDDPVFAEKHGVSVRHVQAIRLGLSWKELRKKLEKKDAGGP